MSSRRIPLLIVAIAALIAVSGAAGEEIIGYTATGGPGLVKPSTQASYTIALTNTSAVRSADRAMIGIPAGFTVVGGSVQATATCGATTWTVDQPVPSADGKIGVRRGSGGSGNNLCPGGTLTIVFSATSSAAEGTFFWATELVRGEDTFVLSGQQPSVQVDGTAPVVTLTSHPANPSNLKSPAFEFSTTEPAWFECKLDGGAFAPCTSPKSYTDLADGTHTFAVKATDAAANTGLEQSYTWQIVTTLPIVMLTNQPSGASKSSTATFAFTASKPATFECKLDGGAFAPCESPKSYSDLANGPHSFSVKATDAANNVGPETTHAWIVDTVPPVATITQKPTNPSNDPSPSFAFTASESVSFECKLDGAAFGACTSPKSYTPPNGSHTFTLRATDAAGNTDQATYTWTIDTLAPTATITQKPTSPSNDPSPTFAFTASESVSFECKLDGAAFGACTSPKSYTPPNGSHTFTLRATDAAGNTGQATYTWTIDTLAPTATITQKPTNPSNVKSPEFRFSAGEAVTFQCKLDQGIFTACGSPKTYTGLPDGVHTFTAKAIDAAGNTGEATYEWLLETNLPIVLISETPPNPANSGSATFGVESSKPDATLKCRVDAGPFEPCTSPVVYIGLADGTHTFAAKATDTANNTGPETVYTWTIDTAGPATGITERPGDPTNSRLATFAFAAGEQGVTFQCSLDEAAFISCASPQIYGGLADGRHKFVVRARDAASNVGPEAAHMWTIETRAPVVSVPAGPSGVGNSTTASLSFSADEPSSFQCSLDDRGFEPCSSPASYAGLRQGAHAFVVRATDAAGNVGAASRSWTIDTTAPQTRLDSAPPTKTTATRVTLRFSSSEPASFQCRLDGGAFASCSSPKSYRGLAGGRHSFAVRATDAAGNVDVTPATSQWTVTRVTRRVTASSLFAPATGARVTRPPLLRWRSVRRSSYYNVQLYRAGRKILTAWPARPRLQLRARWTLNGRIQRLEPGVYRWYVWPGYGRAEARRYGAMLGSSRFVVARGTRRR